MGLRERVERLLGGREPAIEKFSDLEDEMRRVLSNFGAVEYHSNGITFGFLNGKADSMFYEEWDRNVSPDLINPYMWRYERLNGGVAFHLINVGTGRREPLADLDPSMVDKFHHAILHRAIIKVRDIGEGKSI